MRLQELDVGKAQQDPEQDPSARTLLQVQDKELRRSHQDFCDLKSVCLGPDGSLFVVGFAQIPGKGGSPYQKPLLYRLTPKPSPKHAPKP